MSCKKPFTSGLGGISQRHKVLTYIVAALLRSAGRVPQLEVTADRYLRRLYAASNLVPPALPAEMENLRPYITTEGERGGVNLLDISVHGTNDDLLSRYKRKLEKYDVLLKYLPPNSQIIPVTFGAEGAIHPQTMDFIKRTAV